jgi:hypothetical protein
MGSSYSSTRQREEHDGPNLQVGKGSGALTSCSCSCGWRAQRFGPCRVPLVRAWHAHVLASLVVNPTEKDGVMR